MSLVLQLNKSQRMPGGGERKRREILMNNPPIKGFGPPSVWYVRFLCKIHARHEWATGMCRTMEMIRSFEKGLADKGVGTRRYCCQQWLPTKLYWMQASQHVQAVNVCSWVNRSRSDTAANTNTNSDAPRKFASECLPPSLKEKVAK